MDAVNLLKPHSQVVSTNNQNSKHAAENNTASSKQDEVISVAKKFEALMLHSMLKSMRATIVEDELTGSNGQDMYRDMMDQEIAKNISESGGFGIQDVLARQLGANMGVNADGETKAQTSGNDETANATSKSRLAQLQQYQKMSGASDLMFNTQSSLID